MASAELDVEVCNKSWTECQVNIQGNTMNIDTVDVVVALAGDLEGHSESEVGNLDRVQINALHTGLK